MEAKASKLARIDGFKRSLPFMTATALAAVVDKIKQEGLPPVGNRKVFTAAALAGLQDKGYGQVITTMKVHCKDGSSRDLYMANPLALLQAAYSQGGSYYNLVQATLQKHPSNLNKCWDAIFYMDEVQGGNPLGVHQNRECWVLYFSFAQFGPVVLQREKSWLTLLVERTVKVQELHAGVSQIFTAVMKQFFLHPGWDVGSGLLLKGPPNGINARLHIQLGAVLQDGGAHKAVFHAKGDSGTRMCFLCTNLVADRSRLVDGENQLTCKLLSRSQLCMANDNDIKNTIAKIKRNSAEMSVEHFKLYQQATGFNFEPFGLLFCAELEHHIFPASQYVHDWMHTLVANGVFHTVFTAWLEAANGHLDIYTELEKYFDLWVHPVSRKLQHLFSPKRKSSNKEAGVFKCDASEALSLAPILCFYIQKTFLPANVLVAECNVPGQILDKFAAR